MGDQVDEFKIDTDEAEIWARKLNEFGVRDEVGDDRPDPSKSDGAIDDGSEPLKSASASDSTYESESVPDSEPAKVSASESTSNSESEPEASVSGPGPDFESDAGADSELATGFDPAVSATGSTARNPSVEMAKTRSYTRVESQECSRSEKSATHERPNRSRATDGDASWVQRYDEAYHSGVRARAPERSGPHDTYDGARNKRMATRLLVSSVVMFGLTAGFLWKTQEFNRDYRQARGQQKICSDRASGGVDPQNPDSDPSEADLDADFDSTEFVQTFEWKKSPILSQRFFNAELEVVLPGGEFGSARVGDVVPAYKGQVTIMNLWASWCGPCREEMAMFNTTLENNEWGDEVGFVAINTRENGASLPHAAYKMIAKDLPERAHHLADRSIDGTDVLGPLRAKNANLAKVEKGKEVGLPITLVFDCRQRIRWAKFSALAKHDVDGSQLNSLARVVGELVAELSTSRCERRRRSPGKPVQKKKPLPVQEVEALEVDTVDTQVVPTGGSDYGLIPEPTMEEDAPVVRVQRPKKLVVKLEPEPKGPFCGDGNCDSSRGENCRSCKDCVCQNGLECSGKGVPRCMDPGTDI